MTTENVESSKSNPANLTNPNNGDVEQGHVETPTKTKKPVDANIPINAMVMGYVAKARFNMDANAHNNGVPLLVQNARPIPVNLAVNSIAVGFALKALEPASRLFLDFGAVTLRNSGYALSSMIFVFMLIQVLVFLDDTFCLYFAHFDRNQDLDARRQSILFG
ncbi:hypothetical protein DAPPUDRAFT_321481 [Daphnia pulex]|uniref:Uncharacterized protein n=1 Tax=Daphnia pulex TaxID=6669 RepID=E9GTB5_DAPPU|nr:hypothetical protein DAPPUDRAFT_321481 [Daphnia pulex]|eukprot:EFX77251.1 hypothetical protein DAPPUDRAFT_321481 [Daphnia pulex]